MSTINTTISAVTVPIKATVTGEDPTEANILAYVLSQEAHDDEISDVFIPELNNVIDEMNIVAGEVNTNAGTATTQADISTAQAVIATTQAGIATSQAGIATNKADEASASATSAQLDAWISEAEAMTAEAYATTPLNTFVNEYASNGDGTFTAAPTTNYSSLHWAATIDDANILHKTGNETKAGTLTLSAPLRLANSGFNATLQSSTLSADVVITLPSESDTLATISNIFGKNLLLNASGTINQDGYASGTATTFANQYTLDMFRIPTAGQSLVFSTIENITTFTAPAGGVEQVIAGEYIRTGTYVISGLLTATCTVDGVAVENGDILTLTGGTNAVVRWTNGTFRLPQIEEGSVITSFDLKNDKFECMRFYERSYDDGVLIGTGLQNGSEIGFSISSPTVGGMRFKVPKRSTPSINIHHGVTGTVAQVYRISDAAAVVINSLTRIGKNGVESIDLSLSATDSYIYHWTADSRIY